MGIISHFVDSRKLAYRVVRRSSRSNKGQHSKIEGAGRKRKVDVVDDDEGEIRCLCGDNEDDGGFMIQCETCGKWQHGECMGYEDPDEVSDSYACEICRPDLYKDVVPKERERKSEVNTSLKKKPSKEKTVRRNHSKMLTVKKVAKRKTPPSDGSSDDMSDDSDDDEVPLAIQSPKKKPKTIAKVQSPTPKRSPSQEPRKKPAPITTTRRPSQFSPQQRRSSTSANPLTPVTSKTLLVTTFAELPDQNRVPAARIFAKIFEPIEPTKSEALGLAIEHALYTTYATSEHGYGSEYKNKFRSIAFNLKDPKNSALRERVLSGNLAPEVLVKLTSEEMANQELRAQAEKIREEGVAQSVLKVQTGPRIRRTHKGEEIVGGDDVPTAISPTEGIASAPFARVEERSPSVKGEETVPASPRSVGSHRSQSISPPPEIRSPVDTSSERKPSSSSFDIENVWSHLHSPTSQNGPTEPMDLDILPDDLPQNQIDDPDIDRMLNPDGTNSPPYSPSAYAFELPNTAAQIPPIWSGDLTMPSIAHFSAQARFVGGPLSVTDLPWSNILPPRLVIDGRIPIDTTTKYLDAQRSSSTKNVIVIQIDAAEDSDKEMHRKLFQYFHERQRYGVLQIQSNIVKDAYLVPLSPTETIPQQIELMDSHEIPKTRTEPYLLAFLVIQKIVPIEISRSPPSFSPGKSAPPATSPPNSDVPKLFSPVAFPPSVAEKDFGDHSEVTPSVESLGLSPADLAALQGVLIAHPEILSNPQILTNPVILQNLIQQTLQGIGQ
jgi:Transcription factor S-II (TFIIS), central domain/SPOC domain/PHD-finger